MYGGVGGRVGGRRKYVGGCLMGADWCSRRVEGAVGCRRRVRIGCGVGADSESVGDVGGLRGCAEVSGSANVSFVIRQF